MRLAIVMSIVVLSTATPSWGQAATPVPVPFATDCATTSAGTMPSNLQTVAEILEGSQARDELERLEKTYPERFQGAGNHLRKIGAHPTGIVTVARTRRLQFPGSQGDTSSSLLSPTGKLQARSDSYSDSDGEIIISSWDDGNDGTWEGTIYTEDYSTGNWQTWEGQSDIETADYYGIWGYVDATGGPGGGGPLPKSKSSPRDMADKDLRLVTKGAWGDYFTCLSVGAYTCTNLCVFSGPFWGHCMLGCGGLVAVGCAIHVWY